MDEGGASDKDGDEYKAAESVDEIVFETIPQSPMTNWTRSKSQKVIIPDALMCSDSEESVRTNYLACSDSSISTPAQLRQVRVDMPSISDETRISSQTSLARSLQPAREALAAVDKSDQSKTASQGMTRS